MLIAIAIVAIVVLFAIIDHPDFGTRMPEARRLRALQMNANNREIRDLLKSLAGNLPATERMTQSARLDQLLKSNRQLLATD